MFSSKYFIGNLFKLKEQTKGAHFRDTQDKASKQGTQCPETKLWHISLHRPIFYDLHSAHTERQFWEEMLKWFVYFRYVVKKKKRFCPGNAFFQLQHSFKSLCFGLIPSCACTDWHTEERHGVHVWQESLLRLSRFDGPWRRYRLAYRLRWTDWRPDHCWFFSVMWPF